MSTPNPPVSINLVLLPIGTTAASGIIPAASLPAPVIGPVSIPFTDSPNATMVDNLAPPAGWPTPAGLGTIVFTSTLTKVLLTFDDPNHPGMVCQVDVLPVLKPLLTKLTPNALYPGAVQAVDQFGDVSDWGLTTNSFQQPGPAPAVLTHLVLIPS